MEGAVMELEKVVKVMAYKVLDLEEEIVILKNTKILIQMNHLMILLTYKIEPLNFLIKILTSRRKNKLKRK